MKKHLAGFSKVFSFTFFQHLKSKSYKNTTLIISLLCLLIPALLIVVVGAGTEEEVIYEDYAEYEEYIEEEEYVVDMSSLKKVLVVNSDEDKLMNMSSLSIFLKESADYDIEIENFGDNFEKALERAEEDSLIMVVEKMAGSYEADIIIPDGSNVTEDAAYEFMYQLDTYAQLLLASTQIDSQLQQPEKEKEEAYAEEYTEDDFLKEMSTMIINYLNIMIIYFFVLAYGQGVANSVVMEKSSKLIETFLVCVKPTAIVLGKLLAITATGIVQMASWIISLLAGFGIGIAITKAVNPEADLLIIELVETIKIIGEGLFSPIGCIFALMMLAAGLLMYCSLSAIGGAIASKPEDLSSANVLFTMILVASFLLSLYAGGLTGSADSAPWLDWIPFTAVMITPARILLGTMPLWKTIASFAVILVTTLLATALAGKIYKSMVLYKGKMPKPATVIKMLKSK